MSTAVLLASAVALLRPLHALTVVAVLFALVLGASRPVWAVALVFAAIPLELIVIDVGFVGLSAVQIVALFTASLMVVEMLATGRFAVPKTPLDVPIFIWAGTLFMGSAFAWEPVAAMKKAGMTVVFVAIYYLVAAKVRRLSSVSLLMKTLVASSAVVGGYGVWVSYRYLATGLGADKGIIVGSEGLTVPRAASTVGDPTLLAGLMVIATPIAIMLVALSSGWRRLLAVIGCAAVLIALGFTFTRGAWIGAVVALAVLLWDRRSRHVVVVLALLIVLLAPGAVVDRASTSTQFGRAEISHRFDYWQGALLVAPSRPVFGIGLDNFRYAFARLPVSETAQRVAVHAHNVVLVLLAETGLLGLFSFCAVILGALVLLLRRRRSDPSEGRRAWRLAIAASIIGSAAHQMTDSFLLEPTVNSVLWVFAGLAVVFGMGVVTADDDASVVSARASE